MLDFNKAIANGTPTPSAAGNGGGIHNFDTAEAAPEFSPIPPGIYTARVKSGEYTATRKGEDAFRMRFEIVGGEQDGKTVVRTWTFSAKAINYSKRDLAAFGLTTSAQLLSPFPEPGREYVVRLVVALQTGDDGVTRNDIKKIDLLEAKDTPDAEFLLPPTRGEGGPK
jgi:hypothetical protein